MNLFEIFKNFEVQKFLKISKSLKILKISKSSKIFERLEIFYFFFLHILQTDRQTDMRTVVIAHLFLRTGYALRNINKSPELRLKWSQLTIFRIACRRFNPQRITQCFLNGQLFLRSVLAGHHRPNREILTGIATLFGCRVPKKVK